MTVLTHTHTYIYIYVYMYACMYVCVYIYICMHVCMYVYTYIYICVLITKNDDKPLIWFGGVPNFPRNPDKDRPWNWPCPLSSLKNPAHCFTARVIANFWVVPRIPMMMKYHEIWWNIMKYPGFWFGIGVKWCPVTVLSLKHAVRLGDMGRSG